MTKWPRLALECIYTIIHEHLLPKALSWHITCNAGDTKTTQHANIMQCVISAWRTSTWDRALFIDSQQTGLGRK